MSRLRLDGGEGLLECWRIGVIRNGVVEVSDQAGDAASERDDLAKSSGVIDAGQPRRLHRVHRYESIQVSPGQALVNGNAL